MGILLVSYGLLADKAIYQASLGINFDFWRGSVMLGFGLILITFGQRGAPFSALNSHSLRTTFVSMFCYWERPEDIKRSAPRSRERPKNTKRSAPKLRERFSPNISADAILPQPQTQGSSPAMAPCQSSPPSLSLIIGTIYRACAGDQ